MIAQYVLSSNRCELISIKPLCLGRAFAGFRTEQTLSHDQKIDSLPLWDKFVLNMLICHFIQIFRYSDVSTIWTNPDPVWNELRDTDSANCDWDKNERERITRNDSKNERIKRKERNVVVRKRWMRCLYINICLFIWINMHTQTSWSTLMRFRSLEFLLCSFFYEWTAFTRVDRL